MVRAQALYGRLAARAGKPMKLVDPGIELVARGSSAMQMDSFGEWERAVLGHTLDVVDHISVHACYEELDGDAVVGGDLLVTLLNHADLGTYARTRVPPSKAPSTPRPWHVSA